MKYRVLKKCSLVVDKDSIVELDSKQAKLAKDLVLPFEEESNKEEKKKAKKKGE